MTVIYSAYQEQVLNQWALFESEESFVIPKTTLDDPALIDYTSIVHSILSGK